VAQLRRFAGLGAGRRAEGCGRDEEHEGKSREDGGDGDRIGSIHCNAQMGIPEIEEHCRIDDATRAFLQKAMESLSLSARAAHRSLRVARTIADLAKVESVQLDHVAEAVQYQVVEREIRGQPFGGGC
jgi:hypothetical protein